MGRVTALFWFASRMPWSNDAWHMRAITGAVAQSTFMINHVGVGSRSQCLAIAFLSQSVTSSVITGSHVTKGSSTKRRVMSGGGALAVVYDCSRLSLLRKFANSSAEWSVTAFASGCNSWRDLLHIDSVSMPPQKMSNCNSQFIEQITWNDRQNLRWPPNMFPIWTPDGQEYQQRTI